MKILIVRIGRLGDMLMVLPAIRQIEALYPNATFSFITSNDGKRLFKLLGYDDIVIYRRPVIKRVLDTLAIKRLIKSTPFDKVYCFETKLKYHRWMPQGSHLLKPSTNIEHFAKRCQQLVQVDATPPLTNYLDSNPEQLTKNPLLSQQLSKVGIDNNTLLIGLHPSFSGLSRNKAQTIHRLWSANNFAELAKRLHAFGLKKNINLRVVIDLLPEEKKLGEQIVKLSDNTVTLFTPQPNFARYVSYIQRLDLLVTPNTGVMHLAAAANTAVMALFSKFDPRDCGPYMPIENYRVLQAENFPLPQKGLNAIDVDAVYQACIELLTSHLHRFNQQRTTTA